jgi:hypothetical protein
MKTRYALLLVLLFPFASCDNNGEAKISIVGTWQGDKADLLIKPDGFPIAIPYSIDDFDAVVEFKSDGTLSFTDNNQTVTGTYEREGDDLTLNTGFTLNDISLSGTYKIEKLTSTALEIQIEKDATVKNPNDGTDMSGNVKATLVFVRQ